MYFRSGYAFKNADPSLVTPLLQGASSTVNLTLLSRESSVPFFPGATHAQEEVCGGMGITERINKPVPGPAAPPPRRPAIPPSHRPAARVE